MTSWVKASRSPCWARPTRVWSPPGMVSSIQTQHSLISSRPIPGATGRWRGTAGGGTRTHTDLRPGAFEAPSSTIPTLRLRSGGDYSFAVGSGRLDLGQKGEIFEVVQVEPLQHDPLHPGSAPRAQLLGNLIRCADQPAALPLAPPHLGCREPFQRGKKGLMPAQAFFQVSLIPAD